MSAFDEGDFFCLIGVAIFNEAKMSDKDGNGAKLVSTCRQALYHYSPESAVTHAPAMPY